MQPPQLRNLIDALLQRHGSSYHPWGTSQGEMEGTGFTIDGLPVYFSVMLLDGSSVIFDVQVTSKELVPVSLGYDMYMHEGEYSIDSLLRLVERYRSPIEQWPL